MFNKLFRRHAQKMSVTEYKQLKLDILRTKYADNQAMQLHFDRMQSALSASR